jgi:hypothetical protein
MMFITQKYKSTNVNNSTSDKKIPTETVTEEGHTLKQQSEIQPHNLLYLNDQDALRNIVGFLLSQIVFCRMV